MISVHSTDVDGVPCFWVDSGRPTLAVSLQFRFGSADEHFLESGWQHLLEHCVLHGRGGGALQINGSVDLLETAFTAHGPADAVAAHLAEVTAWLADPELEDVEHEAKVLQAEREARGHGGPATRALGWRYGAHGQIGRAHV